MAGSTADTFRSPSGDISIKISSTNVLNTSINAKSVFVSENDSEAIYSLDKISTPEKNINIKNICEIHKIS